MIDRTELGSRTAKGGFSNEKAICEKFNNWEKDKEAKQWLLIMDYNVDSLDSVSAIQVPVRIKKGDARNFGINEIDYDSFIKFKKVDAQIR